MTHSEIVNRLRGALEFATFRSPEIRDAVSNCIKQLAKDMHEVEFEPDVRTVEAFRELDNCITEFENANTEIVEVGAGEVSDDIDDVEVEVPERFIVRDEIEHVLKRDVASIDDDEVDS